MHEIRTQIDIAAAPARVWEILTDFPGHASWNPFVRSIEGIATRDQKLAVTVQPPGGGSMSFRPTVLAAETEKELRWRGQFLMRGLFDGEHYFQLDATAGGGTKFTHGERFSGLLVPLARSSLDKGTRAGFIAMNEALKARAEGSR